MKGCRYLWDRACTCENPEESCAALVTPANPQGRPRMDRAEWVRQFLALTDLPGIGKDPSDT